jgi:HEAT repeat protein
VAPGVRSTDVAIRRRAVRAIAELPGDEAAALLADALGDADPDVRRHAALASGRRGTAAAAPVLVGMVVEGTNDVEAAEVLGTLAQDPARAERILTAFAGELAAHPADSAVRIRLAQALAELPGTTAHALLRQLAGDEDRAVALIASALAGMVEERPGS